MITAKLQNSDWYSALGNQLSKTEQLGLLTIPDSEILSAISLEAVCGKYRAKELIAHSGVWPEIDFDGMRLCMHCSTDGVRCTNYNDQPICKRHEKSAMNSVINFKSVKLRDRYQKELRNPRKLQLGGELAMMRTMLSLMVDKVGDNDQLPLEYIGAITQMCEKISGVVDKMHKMSTITPEHIDNILTKAVDIISRFVPADKLEAIALEIEALDPSKIEADSPFMPGDTLESSDGVRLIETVEPDAPKVKRELVEIADKLGINP